MIPSDKRAENIVSGLDDELRHKMLGEIDGQIAFMKMLAREFDRVAKEARVKALSDAYDEVLNTSPLGDFHDCISRINGLLRSAADDESA